MAMANTSLEPPRHGQQTGFTTSWMGSVFFSMDHCSCLGSLIVIGFQKSNFLQLKHLRVTLCCSHFQLL